MLQLRHTGLYVKNLEKMSNFYKNVFFMHTICENVKQLDEIIYDLLRTDKTGVRITKLITDQGKVNGIGDMLELIQVENSSALADTDTVRHPIYAKGVMHLAFGVDDIKVITQRILSYDGKLFTEIHNLPNGKKCCFCLDPEDNWIELIE